MAGVFGQRTNTDDNEGIKRLTSSSAMQLWSWASYALLTPTVQIHAHMHPPYDQKSVNTA
jgi:hypothetical protein